MRKGTSIPADACPTTLPSPYLHVEVSVSQPPEREIGGELADALRHSTGSYELVVAAVAAGAMGFGLDYLIGTTPIITIIFCIAGFVGAGYSLYLQYQDKMQAETSERTARRTRTAGTATIEGTA